MTNAINAFLANAGKDFYKCFLENRSYLLYLKGLRNTLLIAFGSCLLGLIIGIAVTCVRIIPKDKPIARFFDKVAGLYVTVIRGTPVVLQLFICYFVILKSMKSANFLGIPETRGIPVAIIAFGLNSGAYMAEILRGGINSGRNLCLPFPLTHREKVTPYFCLCHFRCLLRLFQTLITFISPYPFTVCKFNHHFIYTTLFYF